MIKTPIILLSLTFLFLAGCDQQKVAAPVSSTLTTIQLLEEPLDLNLFELPSQALAQWRNFQTDKPALVLYSKDPFLQQIPGEIQKQAIKFIRSASESELLDNTSGYAPDPVILPKMALSAALKAGLFSRVVWVLPVTASIDKLSPEVFREQLVQLGAVPESVARAFTLKEGVLSGKVRGVPFQAIHPEAEIKLTEPVILHFDLSYFGSFYQNEVKTPLFELTYSILRDLRQRGLQATAATFSYSQGSGDVPLGSRFLGPVLAQLFSTPQLLDQPLPQQWHYKKNALFLPNFFKTDETHELYLKMEEKAPEDAHIKYALYEISRQLKDGSKALDYLAQAVGLDKNYALEYLSLAAEAKKKQLPDQGIRMIKLAQKAFPNNPFIGLRLASLLIEQKYGDQAMPLLTQLSKLPWSQFYYPKMQSQITEVQKATLEGASKQRDSE